MYQVLSLPLGTQQVTKPVSALGISIHHSTTPSLSWMASSGPTATSSSPSL